MTLPTRIRTDMIVNGVRTSVMAEARITLAEALRSELGLTGTHVGCEQGICGSCTVLLDGRSVRSCLVLAASCGDRSVVTIEGLASDRGMDPVRDAFSLHHALQCGFCTPGFLAVVAEMLDEGTPAEESLVRSRLSGNLCRCTGYQNIVDATLSILRSAAGST